MAINDMFQGDMDPAIAALLGDDDGSAGQDTGPIPDFDTLFNNGSASQDTEPIPDFDSLFNDGKGSAKTPVEEANAIQEKFPELTKLEETNPTQAFDDPEYYKQAIGGEGDIAQRMHTVLDKYLKTSDPKDRSVYRQQFLTAYWEFLLNVARRTGDTLIEPKKFLLRFALLHPSFLNPENKAFFQKIVINNELSQPIYYLDEWFKLIGSGAVKTSSTDEVRVAKGNAQVHLQGLLDKALAKLDSNKHFLRTHDYERKNTEKMLIERVSSLAEHNPLDRMPDVGQCYHEGQKHVFQDAQELMKQLLKVDHDMAVMLRELAQAEEDVGSLKEKIEEEGGNAGVDVMAVDTEFESVKQMTKLTIGRQGNHFPILINDYFHCLPKDVGHRENIIKELTLLESIDPECFTRTHKNRKLRIVPYVILLPCYGDTGICWEPFDRHNRATSRGRIAIPMYPKNLQLAILNAMGDLRWQVAKEKASYYWMEEGITGDYYQWFQRMKMKGDVKEAFIADYILWITKESDAVQKIDKEVRTMFWIKIPFSKAIKDKVKDRSIVYNNLYKGDMARNIRGF
ncbi:hypothetical protein ACYULU_09330 [Breznakiellaceae bacterium SP9]